MHTILVSVSFSICTLSTRKLTYYKSWGVKQRTVHISFWSSHEQIGNSIRFSASLLWLRGFLCILPFIRSTLTHFVHLWFPVSHRSPLLSSHTSGSAALLFCTRHNTTVSLSVQCTGSSSSTICISRHGAQKFRISACLSLYRYRLKFRLPCPDMKGIEASIHE